MVIKAEIIEDSISEAGERLTTFQLRYPRFIHAEFMTHRQFSRNASSSRAIPVKRALASIREEPAMPIHWGINQPGMQARDEATSELVQQGQDLWHEACESACAFAEKLNDLGFHKQIVNRLTEPFQHINVVQSATHWSNWYALRAHADAMPEIRILAEKMQEAQERSTPNLLVPGQWHLPYIKDDDKTFFLNNTIERDALKKVSSARCARVSYMTFDGKVSEFRDDVALCNKLIGSKPLHASPFEHQATPDTSTHFPFYSDAEDARIYDHPHLHGNFYGWCQYRKYFDEECQ
jgi:thymidylate synthase ThyX